MVRNAIKSDFQSSKMAARGHFVKKKLGIYLKYREMRLKVFSVIQSEKQIHCHLADLGDQINLEYQ